MAEKDANLNLMQKLAKIRSMSDVVEKNKKGFNYKYTDITSILANVTAGMRKYGVSLIPYIVPETACVVPNTISKTKFTKTGEQYTDTKTEMLVTADMVFKWVNDEDPSDYIEVPWFLTGSQEDPSQGYGSALTYCTRYFMIEYFQIAQPETDVDEYRSKQKEAESSEERTIAEEIINTFDIKLKEYLADHQDKSQEVQKFVGRYAKNAKYTAIKEPKLAAKLLADFEAEYLDKE